MTPSGRTNVRAMNSKPLLWVIAPALVVLAGIGVAMMMATRDTFATAGDGAKKTETQTDIVAAVHSRATQGENELELTLSASSLTVADRLTLELRFTSASPAPPEWPKNLEAIEGLRIVDKRDEGPLPAVAMANTTGTQRFTFKRTLTLEPFLPGTRTIPAVQIALPGNNTTSINTTTPPQTASVSTQPIPITVTGIVDNADKLQAKELAAAISGARMPMDIPDAAARGFPVGIVVAISGGLLATSLGLIGWRLSQRPKAQTPSDYAASLAATIRKIQSTPPAAVPTSSQETQSQLDSVWSDLRAVLQPYLGSTTTTATELSELVRHANGFTLEQRTGLIEGMHWLDTARFSGDEDARRSALYRATAPLLAFIRPMTSTFGDHESHLAQGATAAPPIAPGNHTGGSNA